MSVIQLEPKELANIRNLLLANRTAEPQRIDTHLQALMDCNAKTYSLKYPKDGVIKPHTVKELMDYFKIGQTKQELLAALESFQSLIYNCDLELNGESQIAYRYLTSELMRFQVSKLKAAWGIEK